jgi:hypothetical protein
MVPYETYCKILQLQQENLRVSQIAAVLGVDERTVQKWIDEKCYHQRIATQRASKLDPYKAHIIRTANTLLIFLNNAPALCHRLAHYT